MNECNFGNTIYSKPDFMLIHYFQIVNALKKVDEFCFECHDDGFF